MSCGHSKSYAMLTDVPLLQMVVEKMLREEGRSRLEMGRAAFEERVWQWKAEYGGFITRQMRQMGASCDWSRERFTLDAQLSGEPARDDSSLTQVPGVTRTAKQPHRVADAPDWRLL